MLTSLKQAMHLIGREHRLRWVLLVILALVSSGFELVGAALVYLLLALISNPTDAVELPIVGDVRTWFAVDEQTLLYGLAAAMAVFFLIRAVVHVGEAYAQNRVGHNAGARLAAKLVTGYLTMPYAFHLQRSSADLIRNSHQAVKEVVSQVFLPVIRIAAELVMVLAMLAFLLIIAPLATAIAVLVLGSAAALLLVIIQPRLKRLGRTAHELQRETLGSLQQSLHGIRDIKVLGREHAFGNTYARARKRLARATYLRTTATELPRTVIETALVGFILVFFVIAIARGGRAEETLSVLGLFAYAGMRLQPSLQRIISGLNNLKFSTAPLMDIHRDLVTIEAHEERSPVASTPITFERELALENVRFCYEGTDELALKGIDLSIGPGEVIGFCGPTGGGKTTLVDVVAGLLEPTSGRVTIDGVDLRTDERGWQQHLGFVSQMVFLLDDTLRHNIALGVPDPEIDDEALHQALHLAQLRDFVESLPMGLEAVVGERGIRISGGQRQRIAIARALYRRPSVLIFDEGTSALDNATEAELMAALERLRGAHTILLVAHRLSTVRDCDRIAYIESGRITGMGSYEDLVAHHDAFRRLAAT